jgi:hypothetical protein
MSQESALSRALARIDELEAELAVVRDIRHAAETNANTWRGQAAKFYKETNELRAENASLRNAIIVKPNERLILVAPMHALESGLLQMFEDLYRLPCADVIVLPHDWRVIPIDELRKVAGTHIESMIVSGPGAVGIDLG